MGAAGTELNEGVGAGGTVGAGEPATAGSGTAGSRAVSGLTSGGGVTGARAEGMLGGGRGGGLAAGVGRGGGGVFATMAGAGAGAASRGSVTDCGEDEVLGRSIRRSEPVGFLGRTGGGIAAVTVGSGGAESEGCGITGGGGPEGVAVEGVGEAILATGIGDDLPTAGSGCVAGSAGGRAWWEIGARSSGISTLPLWTNTLAPGLATMTRGAVEPGIRPEALVSSAAGVGVGLAAGAAGSAGGGVGAPRIGTRWDGGFWGKSGVVLELAGAPVMGGAIGVGGGAAGADAVVGMAPRRVVGGLSRPEEGLTMLGIGLVTAVDHAGGTLVAGAGSS